MQKLPLLILLPFLMTGLAHAQPGGRAYQFLEVTPSARIAATGGSSPAPYDDDLNFAHQNPALLNPLMQQKLALNYVSYFAGIHYGYAAYAFQAPWKGMMSAGIHYLNYGQFNGADETGASTGTFRAADYSLNFSYARQFDSLISAGVTLKSIYSDLETYSSTAFAIDAGVSYHSADGAFSAGLVVRNIGWQLSTYYPYGDREPLPFNIAMGITQKLQYAPFRFFVTAEHLEKWDLSYTSSLDSSGDLNTDAAPEGGFDRFFDRLMRHAGLGIEFIPTDNFTLRAGYNYRRRQELKVESKPGMVGFSMGAGIVISKFRFDYGRTIYHLAGAVNYFSLSINLDELNNIW